MTREQLIDAFSTAIAHAEGYFVDGSRADRNNNPGNITVDLTGTGIGMDGMFIIYANAYDGWQALKKQVSMILDDTSNIYTSDMTLYEIAQRYTTTQQLEWANNVASYLGVSTNVPIKSLITGTTIGVGVFVLIFVGLWYLNKKKGQ